MNETGKIFSLITKIMGEVGAIEKTRKNNAPGQGGYNFRGIDDVYAALQPLLSKFGVFFSPEVIDQSREERQAKSGGVLIYTILKVRFTFFADDGSHFPAIAVGEAMDSSDKSSNKAMSAALKIVCLQVFCIPTEEPKDTENDTPEPTPRAEPQKMQSRTPHGHGSAAHTAQPPSEAQIKRLFAIAGSARWTNDQVKEFLVARFNIESTKDLSIDQYNEICNLMPTTKFEDAIGEFQRYK